MSKKTIVSVDLLCSKCRKKVMKLIADIEGITSIALDSSKNTITVVGVADPVKIMKKVRKYRKSANVESVGDPKDEKKDEKKIKFAMSRRHAGNATCGTLWEKIVSITVPFYERPVIHGPFVLMLGFFLTILSNEAMHI